MVSTRMSFQHLVEERAHLWRVACQASTPEVWRREYWAVRKQEHKWVGAAREKYGSAVQGVDWENRRTFVLWLNPRKVEAIPSMPLRLPGVRVDVGLADLRVEDVPGVVTLLARIKPSGLRVELQGSRELPLETILHPVRSSLRRLTLDGVRLDRRSVAYVMSLPRLASLKLYNNAVEASSVPGHRYFSRAESLRDFHMGGSPSGDAVVQALVRSSCARRIEGIGLWGSSMEESTSLRSLLELPKLRRLSLSGNKKIGRQIDPSWDGWSRLLEIGLARTGLDERAAVALMSSASFGVLEDLSIGGNSIGSKGLRALLSNRTVRRLRSLLVDETGLGDEAIVELAESRVFRRLRYLDVADNSVTSEGVGSLIRALPGSRCERLFLNGCSLEALRANLVDHRMALSRLVELDVRYSGIPTRTLDAFAKRLKNTYVYV